MYSTIPHTCMPLYVRFSPEKGLGIVGGCGLDMAFVTMSIIFIPISKGPTVKDKGATEPKDEGATELKGDRENAMLFNHI